MPYSPDPQASSRSSLLAVAILIAAGYSLTLLVFYPGVMTYDAKFVYEDIAKHTLGDWQSPAMKRRRACACSEFRARKSWTSSIAARCS